MKEIIADVQIEVDIRATITEEGGYWREISLQDFADKIDLSHYQFWISQGGSTVPKRIPAKITVGRVLVTPKRKE